MAFFPGSTVPHIKYVKQSKERNVVGANQLMTSYYQDYRKGIHKAGTDRALEAFRQTQGHPVRRTADDFDIDDRVEFENPFDNIHTAWSVGITHDYYGSAGCQVIVGYPECPKRENKPDVGAWKEFKSNAYVSDQGRYPYILLTGWYAQRVVMAKDHKLTGRLRFRSTGELVEKVQKALHASGHYEDQIHGDFGVRTLRALLRYQTQTFGPSADDGIIGPITAESLGVELPGV